jgi:YihY family inner membrane protein
MVFFTIAVSYVFFPKIKVRIWHALAGALFSTIFLEIAKHIFTWYVGTVIVFGTIYGPLTAFIVFLLDWCRDCPQSQNRQAINRGDSAIDPVN